MIELQDGMLLYHGSYIGIPAIGKKFFNSYFVCFRCAGDTKVNATDILL